MTASQNATRTEQRGPQSSDSTRELDTDDLFYLLGNDRRRSTVEILADTQHAVGVSALADEITDGDDGSYKSVYVSLQQSHLPQLDEHEVVSYDRDAREVRRGRHFEDVAAYVTTENPSSNDWRAYFVGAVVSLVATGGSALLAGVESEVTAGIAAVSLLVIVGYAGYQAAGSA
ncbi:MAG: ArsR family transcriptional regulator [Haloferacaceae archaeon]